VRPKQPAKPKKPKKPKPDPAAHAIWALGRIGGRDARRQLNAALDYPDAALRGEAIRALGVIGDGRTTSRLIKLLRSDPDPDIRFWAAYALGNIDGKRATTALREVLANRAEKPSVRAMAAEQLVFSREAIPDLVAGLRDASREVRFWSAYALGEMRADVALPALRRLAARDRTRVPGWWSVAREAKSAITTIERGWFA